jgi:hypothetical protein
VYRDRLRAWMRPDEAQIESFDMADNVMLVGSNLAGLPERIPQTVAGLYGSFEEALDACLAALRR